MPFSKLVLVALLSFSMIACQMGQVRPTSELCSNPGSSDCQTVAGVEISNKKSDEPSKFRKFLDDNPGFLPGVGIVLVWLGYTGWSPGDRDDD